MSTASRIMLTLAVGLVVGLGYHLACNTPAPPLRFYSTMTNGSVVFGRGELILETTTIHYGRDDRTGVCFAYAWSGGGGAGGARQTLSFTAIPCSVIPDGGVSP